MRMRENSSRRRITWVAGVVLVVSCAAGIAATTQWSPRSAASPDDVVVPTEIPPDLAQQSAEDAALRLMRASRARCPECGVIEWTREIGKSSEASGNDQCAARATENADLEKLLDWHMIALKGYVRHAIVCAPQRAAAAAVVVAASKGYEILVRFRDGSSQLLTEASLSTWRRGERVKIVAAGID